MEYGFVYLLGNKFMPSIYKIGFTLRHPRERAEELSSTTGCPFPFELISFFDCPDPCDVEKAIHAALDQYRVNDNREFFCAPLDEIHQLFSDYSMGEEGVFLSESLEIMSCKQKNESKNKYLLSLFFSQNADPIYWGFDK